MKEIELFEGESIAPDVLFRLVTPDLKRLSNLYKAYGYELRIVGGAVRDILQAQSPKDIDLASDATPEESIELLKDANIRVIETGLQHGTIVAHINGEDYEITTLRIDVETDGRHAEVEYTKDWEIDAERRDLTYNAMSMDFDGNVYDYHGGREDLAKGRTRFVGDARKRIEEDYLRILRYFRFSGRTASPQPNETILQQIKINAAGLQQISGERIWAEFAKILSGNHLEMIILQMEETDVLENIGLPPPDLYELLRVKEHTDSPPLLLAALLPNPAALSAVDKHWKFSKGERVVMHFVLTTRDRSVDLITAKKLHVLYRIPMEQVLKLLEYQGEFRIGKELAKWEIPTFPVKGADLLAAGMEPGPDVGIVLQRLLTQWVDSAYTLTRNELLDTIGNT